jgi:hypothetical protein
MSDVRKNHVKWKVVKHCVNSVYSFGVGRITTIVTVFAATNFTRGSPRKSGSRITINDDLRQAQTGKLILKLHCQGSCQSMR